MNLTHATPKPDAGSKTMDQVFDEAVEIARSEWVQSPYTSPLEAISRQLRKMAEYADFTPEQNAKIQDLVATTVFSEEGLSKALERTLSDSYRRDSVMSEALHAAIKANQPAIDEVLAGIIESKGEIIVAEMFRNALAGAASTVIQGVANHLFAAVGDRINMAIMNAKHMPSRF